MLASGAGWCFGVVSLFVGLAILTSVPVGQFLVLGYLLEVTGRVARTGRLRDGFVGVRTAGKLGGVALGCACLWLPLYFLSIFAENATIIDPGGRTARRLHLALGVLGLLYMLHVIAACLRGGRLRDFLRPFNLLWLVRRVARGGAYAEARDGLWHFVAGLRLPYYFWRGLRGFVGAFLWLVVPLSLLGQGHENPLLAVIGGLLLGVVVMRLPFLQARFARDDRLRAYCELRSVRADFARAPLAFAVALTVHLSSAVPLYLLKIEVIPRDLMFLEGLVFLLFMFPARLLGGWAYARSARRDAPRHGLWRWAARLAVLPVVAAYVLVVFASQHVGWYGIPSLYEQHAFLLPVPFVTGPD